MRHNMTPTLLARAARCLHAWHLECHEDAALKVEADAGTKMIWERGLEHERQMVASLSSYQEPDWDGKDWDTGLEATLRLMKDGVEWIYQGVLVRSDMFGKPDLLQRIDAPSNLGAHSYRPVDIKGHKAVNRKDRMQLAAYAFMLELMLGHRPEQGAIWLNTGAIEDVDLTRPNQEFDEIRAEMIAVRDEKTDSVGFRCGECGLCSWSAVCAQAWQDRDCVCLVRSVTGETARKLWAAGIRDFRKMAELAPQDLMDTLGCSKSHAEHLHIHARARAQGRPIIKAPLPDHGDRPIIHYDIETYGDCVYLHGLLVCQGDKRSEHSFLARSPEKEKPVWHAFLDFLAGFPEAVVYNWADYERGHAKRLWKDHGGNPAGWQVLESNMFDLCRIVKDCAALPVATYSIKEVAPVFGFHWQAEDAGGLNSEAWYGEWLENGDEKVLDKIVEYNLDDVRAMDTIFLGIHSNV